jgi:hypothetical protein
MRQCLGPILGALLIVSIPAAAAAAAQHAPQAQPDEAAKLAEARAIVAIISPPADRERTLDTLLPKFVAQFRPKFPPAMMADAGLQAIIDGEAKEMIAEERPLILKHMPDQAEANAIAYTHEFSLAELKQIHAFAQTPAGHHYLSRSASLVTDPAVAKANTALFADVQQVAAAHKAELKQKLIAYFTAHPDRAKELKGEEQGK